MLAKQAFGKTGHESSRCLFGAAALSGVTQAVAERTLEVLLRHGVNHIDVAASYGEAELRVGPWMKRQRGDFFLATKTGERGRTKARDEIRRSLERLQTDRIDLIQLHAVQTMEELEAALGTDGALEAAADARAEGLVRFIGITSHGLLAPAVLLRALERFEFASVLLPYNYPLMQNPEYAAGFDRLAGVCAGRGVALQTIKSICRRPWGEGAEHTTTTWYEPLTEKKNIDLAVRFVLGRPQLFLNTVSDVALLPRVLEAASRFSGTPEDSEMQKMAADLAMRPLWAPEE
ncbi:MAG: aldo/keto reductase [Anaerolineales bacterium]|nr:aldo/keto reductase [Anaerolineales bacterium]